jgi:hypothetical protein
MASKHEEVCAGVVDDEVFFAKCGPMKTGPAIPPEDVIVRKVGTMSKETAHKFARLHVSLVSVGNHMENELSPFPRLSNVMIRFTGKTINLLFVQVWIITSQYHPQHNFIIICLLLSYFSHKDGSR